MPRFLTVVTIGGMRTTHCVRAVFTALGGASGVTRAAVQMGRAEVEHDGSATPDAIRTAIAVAGYTVLDTKEERHRELPLL